MGGIFFPFHFYNLLYFYLTFYFSVICLHFNAFPLLGIRLNVEKPFLSWEVCKRAKAFACAMLSSIVQILPLYYQVEIYLLSKFVLFLRYILRIKYRKRTFFRFLSYTFLLMTVAE